MLYFPGKFFSIYHSIHYLVFKKIKFFSKKNIESYHAGNDSKIEFFKKNHDTPIFVFPFIHPFVCSYFIIQVRHENFDNFNWVVIFFSIEKNENNLNIFFGLKSQSLNMMRKTTMKIPEFSFWNFPHLIIIFIIIVVMVVDDFHFFCPFLSIDLELK